METESTGVPENQADQNFVAPETGGEAKPDIAASRPEEVNVPADQGAIEQLYTGVQEQYGPAGLAALDLIHEVDRPDGPEKVMRVTAALDQVSAEQIKAIKRTAEFSGANTEYLDWALQAKFAEEKGLLPPGMPTRPTLGS